MPSNIPKQLKSLLHNIQQEFRGAPLKTSAAVIVLCTFLVTLINYAVQFFSPSKAIKFLTITTENSLLLITLSVGLLVWSLFILIKKPIVLDNQKSNVLSYLAMQHNPITADSIATNLVIHIDTVRFHLDKLKNLKMADLNNNHWSITHRGRAYLSDNNLLP